MTKKKRYKLSAGKTAPDLAGAKELESLSQNELENIRKAAASWRTGLAGLFTLIATIMVVKGRESIVELPEWAQIAVGICLIAALVTAAAGSILAMRSAFGLPKEIKLPSGSVSLRAWKYDESRKAIRFLKWAIGLTVATLVILPIAIALTWYIQAEPIAYLSVATETKKYCGELIKSDADEIELATSDYGTDSILLEDITSLDIVGKCE